MSDYLTAHASVAVAIRAAQPLPTAHAEIVALVADHIRIGANGAVDVLDTDGSVALDREAGFAPMTPAGFVEKLKATRPWIFDATAKPQRTSASAPATPKQPETLTEMMVAAKRGDAAAKAALDARLKL